MEYSLGKGACSIRCIYSVEPISVLRSLPRKRRACPGKPGGNRFSRRRMPRKTAVFRLLLVCETQKEDEGMRFHT